MEYTYNFSNTEIAQIRQVDKPITNELNILLNNINNILHVTYIQYIDIGDIKGFGYDNDNNIPTEFSHVGDNGFKKFVTALNGYLRDINDNLLQLELQKGIIAEINNTNYMTFNYTYTEISASDTLVRIPKPIKPSSSNTSNTVTYAQFVKFGTLHGFGYSNINDIETWADFVTAINNYLININDRINALNNEPSIPSDNYWYVGTSTTPPTAENYQTILTQVDENDNPYTFTNTNVRHYMYIVVREDKSVQSIKDGQFDTGYGEYNNITIPGHKVYRSNSAISLNGSLIITIE